MTIMSVAQNMRSAEAYYPKHYQLKLWKAPTAESYDNELGEGHYDISAGDPKLEGTLGEHWSPSWRQIVTTYQLTDGSHIIPDNIPSGKWITIQTPISKEERVEIGKIWVIPAELISNEPFEVNGYKINEPTSAMICIADEDGLPALEWGCWYINKKVFANTYVSYRS